MENYLYAGARIRALEGEMIGSERLERLLSCATTEACAALLAEWGVTILRGREDGAFDREATLAARLSQAYAEVLEATDGASFARIWLLPYDCNNIKSVIKCARRGLDPEPMLIRLSGGIPTDVVRYAIEKRDRTRLPEPFATAAQDAAAQFERTGDPRIVDRILDAACYAQMVRLAEESCVELALRLVQRRIDLTNVMIAIRSGRMGDVGERTLAEFFLAGGTLSLADLSAWLREGESYLLERLYYNGFENFAKAANGDGIASPADLERAADDGVMELAREAKLVPLGAEIPIGYLIGREYEVKNLRILLAGKSVGLSTDAVRERMRLSYV